MANQSNATVTLDDATTAILDSIRAQFPDLQTVEAYPEDDTHISVPGVLIEMEEMEPADDMGTGQTPMITRWVAHIIIGFGPPPTIKRQVRMLAVALTSHIRLNRFGLPIGAAEIIGAFPDDFTPELAQYEAWRVEWTHRIDFGESVWWGEGITPTKLFIGYDPDIGADHESDYTEIEP